MPAVAVKTANSPQTLSRGPQRAHAAEAESAQPTSTAPTQTLRFIEECASAFAETAARQDQPSYITTRRLGSLPELAEDSPCRSAIWCCKWRTYELCGLSSA